MSARSAMHGESGYERVENDAYFTPAWCTEALLNYTSQLFSPVWDPACGDGAILKVCAAREMKTLGSDIRDYGWPGTFIFDFFKYETAVSRSIITNPPYECAQQFIEKALKLTEPQTGTVAMLLRNEYDSAGSRRHLFGDHPAFAKKLVLTRRPKWFAHEKAAPRHNFSWFLWSWGKSAIERPTLGYLP